VTVTTCHSAVRSLVLVILWLTRAFIKLLPVQQPRCTQVSRSSS